MWKEQSEMYNAQDQMSKTKKSRSKNDRLAVPRPYETKKINAKEELDMKQRVRYQMSWQAFLVQLLNNQSLLVRRRKRESNERESVRNMHGWLRGERSSGGVE